MAIKGKKGIFFTIIAIMLVTLLSIAFTPYDYVSYKDRIPAITGRIGVANTYVKTLEQSYVKAAVETSGRDALVALVLFINKTTYLPSFGAVNSTFSELMLNGSVNGTPVECYLDNKPLTASVCIASLNPDYNVMKNKNLLFKFSSIENVSRDVLLIRTDFRDSNDGYVVSLFQDNATGPWRVGINLITNYTVDASIVYWNISQNITVNVPVEGLLDPVYLVNASFNNTIARTNSTVWDVNNLSKLVQEMKYSFEPNAPSFLMRLYYNLSNGGNNISGSACCGIESPINPNRLNIPMCTKKSYIDWCFYSNNCTQGDLYNINGITTYTDGEQYLGFKMDLYHEIGPYNLSAGHLSPIDPLVCP